MTINVVASALVAVAAAAANSTVPPEDTAVETFSPPKRVELKPPTYPFAQRRKGNEGWVSLNFMVDPDGVPYDITVNDSSGEPAFERAAVLAAKDFRYEPAVFNGKAIDAGANASVTFQLSGESGARSIFVRRYKRYSRLLGDGDEAAAADTLESLGELNRNLYEEAYYQLVLSQKYQQEGNFDAEYQALKRAGFIDKDRGYLPDDALTSVLLRKMDLELKLNKLVQAHMTIRNLQKRELDPELHTQLDEVAAAIRSVATADGVVKSNGRIRHDNLYVHELIKRTFGLEEIDGDVAEARLHCNKGSVGFVYREEMQYTVNEDWDNCTLFLIGNPDTTFVLVER